MIYAGKGKLGKLGKLLGKLGKMGKTGSGRAREDRAT